jgi:hypothetical protein
MSFTSDDVQPAGWVIGTAMHDYAILRDGQQVGRVRVPSPTITDETPARIARRLSDMEAAEGAQHLDAMLSATLVLTS